MSLTLSGERFYAHYRIVGSQSEAALRARAVCVEQTIEFPYELVANDTIKTQIVGEVISVDPTEDGSCQVCISFAVEIVGGELSQLLNVLFGNISLQPGIRLERVEFTKEIISLMEGPRFGPEGLRKLLGVARRPLLCTALKPMGLGPKALALMAGKVAQGVDLVKDDHGLVNQPFCQFQERVSRCAEAVAKTEAISGRKCLYFPNVSAPFGQLRERALWAKKAGAGGLLIAPGLVSFEAMKALSDDPDLGLPLMSHPAFLGSYVMHPEQGISHYALFGQITRLAGGDAVIFPNYGGRFSFSQADCRSLIAGAFVSIPGVRSCMPVPAGGMSLASVPEMVSFYGNEVILLIGGDLHRSSALEERCITFRELAEESSLASS